MAVIRVVFDGKNFVPQEPVSLPDRSEAIVLTNQKDPAAQKRAYYQHQREDEDDNIWSSPDPRAWDED